MTMGLRLVLAWLVGLVLVGVGAHAVRADGGLGEAPPKPGASTGGPEGGIGGKPTSPEKPTAEKAPEENVPSAERPRPDDPPTAERPVPPVVAAPRPAPPVAQAPSYRPPATAYRPQAPTVSTPGDGYDLRRQRTEPVIIVKTPPSQPSQPWYGWKSMPPFNHVGGGSSTSSSWKK